MSQKKVLVTGGAGFIGSHIAENYLSQGAKVWVVDNLKTGTRQNIEPLLANPNFHFDEADICNWSKLEEAVIWADLIFHMAASVGQYYVLAHAADTLVNNIESCEKILKTMDNTLSKARLLVASTSSVYLHGLPADGMHKEADKLEFHSGEYLQENYPISKLVDEVLSLSYVHERGLDVTIVRIFNTIGKNQVSAYGMVVPIFVKQALNNEDLTVYGDGLQRRSFCDIRDTVRAMDLLIKNPESKGEIFNIGNDRDISILDLAKLIIKRANSKSKIKFVPYKEAYGMDFKDIQKRIPNLKKINELTGYEPKYSLEDSIDNIIQGIQKTEKNQNLKL